MADESGNDGAANFEDGMHWLLPSNVLDEADAFDDKKKVQLASQKYHPQPKWPHSRTPAAEPPLHPLSGLRSSQPRPQRSRNGTNAKSAFGGPGMRAVFLDSGRQTSCGTGVFLPRRAGTQFHSSTKPACPPVLLPSRVVQALNLNVHELGQRKQKKPHQECARLKTKSGGGDCNLVNGIDRSTDGAAEWRSPEIFLPKEWTY